MQGICLGNCTVEWVGVSQLSGSRCQVRAGKGRIWSEETALALVFTPGVCSTSHRTGGVSKIAYCCLPAEKQTSMSSIWEWVQGGEEVGMGWGDTSSSILSYFPSQGWRNLWWCESWLIFTKCKSASAIWPWLNVKNESEPQGVEWQLWT